VDQASIKDNFLFEQDYWWFLGRRKIVSNLIRGALGEQKRRLALDAGCGTGIVLEDLKEYASPVGIDASEDALKFTQKRGCNNIFCGDICRLPFKSETFDLITILGVLYNQGIRDEEAAINEAYRVLRKGGFIIIDEAAYNFLQSKHNISVGGKRRYTRTQLSEILKNQGFKILKSSHWNVAALPVFLLIVVAEKILVKNKRLSRLKRLPRIINASLRRYLYLEAALMKYINFPFGPSIIILAEK